jgi:hypothetical protein
MKIEATWSSETLQTIRPLHGITTLKTGAAKRIFRTDYEEKGRNKNILRGYGMQENKEDPRGDGEKSGKMVCRTYPEE